jgi:hypothetical protein
MVCSASTCYDVRQAKALLLSAKISFLGCQLNERAAAIVPTAVCAECEALRVLTLQATK